MPNQLTPRQLEIFHLIAKGLSNKEICSLLEISNNTVKIHVTSILRTLGVSNRTEAVFAYQELLEESGASQGGSNRLKLVDRLGRPAIAVLPFEDLSGDSDDDHLLQGIVEELLVRLSAWQWFPVIAYASSRRFDPQNSDPQHLGNELAARYLVYGSLRRSGTRVRVTVRLVDTNIAQEIWSRTFDSQFDNLFDLQDEIASHVVTIMAPELIDAEAQNANSNNAANATAWELVCRGMRGLTQHNKVHNDLAFETFRQAVEIAPEYSLGWHGQVCALQQSLFEQWCDDPQACIEQMNASAQRCIQIEPSSAHALTDMGVVHVILGQREPALDYLERAVSINPSSTRALSTLAQAYGMAGRLDDCIMQSEELLRVDPHSPSSARYRTIIGMCHCLGGRPQEAIEWCRDALARDRNAAGAYLALIASFVELDNLDGAQQAVKDMRSNNPEFDVRDRIAMLKPFTEPELLKHLVGNLQKAGINTD